MESVKKGPVAGNSSEGLSDYLFFGDSQEQLSGSPSGNSVKPPIQFTEGLLILSALWNSVKPL
jgi:hypothetical protein